MKVLVINCGSSSLKYQLIDMDDEHVLCKGNCERVGMPEGRIIHKANGHEWEFNEDVPDHTKAFMRIVDIMTKGETAVVWDKSEIDAIGHRVAQGADRFTHSVLATEQVIQTIEDIIPLAPVHNPAHVAGLRAAQQVFGKDIPQAVVFDTTFHQTMPPKAYMYALPYEYYKDLSVRKYGFHGTSHRYVSYKAAKELGLNLRDLRMVTCHLGNGASCAAVYGGKCIDTTMGMTPLSGLMMGTRCGDIDPSIIAYLQEKTGKSAEEMDRILNKESGFKGLSGISSDNRDVLQAAANGNERAQLVADMFAYQIKKYIGSYAAAMNGLDVLVFTGGIGENAYEVRQSVCSGMSYFGIEIDEEANKCRGKNIDISAPGSKVKTLVICTNEELMIARDTKALVEGKDLA